MYLRSKLQPRALTNLRIISESKYPNMRVTRGYVVSDLLMNHLSVISDTENLKRAIVESDLKQEGGSTAVNLNITAEANEKLEELKKILDKETGRSLFPAQVLDILFICALNNNSENIKTERKVSNEKLAKAMLDYAYKLLTEETLSVDMRNAKQGLITVLIDNHLC